MERFLSEKELVKQIGFSRVTLWRKVRAQEFPPPRNISVGRKAWFASEVEGWINARPVADAYQSVEESET